MTPKDVAAPETRCEMGGLPQDTIDGRDTEGEHLLEAQRRRARKVGALLVLVVAVIVAVVFAWKLSLQR